jgi:hypothetical protein
METWLLLNVPTAVLAILVLLLTVGTAITGLVLVRRSVELSTLEAQHDVAGFIIAVVGVVYAVLLAFVVVIVWQQFEDAKAVADREATLLVAVYRDSAALAAHGPDARPATRRYALSVANVEWDVMATKHTESRATDAALNSVWRALQAVHPRTDAQSTYYDSAVNRLHEAAELRETRILNSGSPLPGVLWFVLIVGGVISIGFTFFFGVRRFAAQALMVGALSALVGLVLLLILTLDLPFTGNVGVDSSAMQHTVEEFARIGS